MTESTARGDFQGSVCPHDCPSTCALEVEVRRDAAGIGRGLGAVRGAEANSYTAGVICAKVARYAERVHHPDRLLRPLLRTGPKGSGQFREIGFEEALDRVAEGAQVAGVDALDQLLEGRAVVLHEDVNQSAPECEVGGVPAERHVRAAVVEKPEEEEAAAGDGHMH